MKTIFDHIERAKAQPHRIRKQIAIGTATFGTVFIALVWVAGSLAQGVFSIRDDTSFASNAEPSGITADAAASASQNLAGAGAAAGFAQQESTPAHIEIIDSAPAPSKQKIREQTTIPF